MSSIAHIALYGRLGQDPRQLGTTANGHNMAGGSMVCSLPCRQTEEGEAPLWLNLLAFAIVADQLLRLKKGDLLSVSGELQLSRYTSKSGETKENLQVLVQSIVSARSSRPWTGKREQKPQPATAASYRAQAAGFDDELDF